MPFIQRHRRGLHDVPAVITFIIVPVRTDRVEYAMFILEKIDVRLAVRKKKTDLAVLLYFYERVQLIKRRERLTSPPSHKHREAFCSCRNRQMKQISLGPVSFLA